MSVKNALTQWAVIFDRYFSNWRLFNYFYSQSPFHHIKCDYIHLISIKREHSSFCSFVSSISHHFVSLFNAFFWFGYYNALTKDPPNWRVIHEIGSRDRQRGISVYSLSLTTFSSKVNGLMTALVTDRSLVHRAITYIAEGGCRYYCKRLAHLYASREVPYVLTAFIHFACFIRRVGEILKAEVSTSFVCEMTKILKTSAVLRCGTGKIWKPNGRRTG